MASCDPMAIAIAICNKDSFKTDVFSALYPEQGTPEEIKSSWDEKVEELTKGFLRRYDLQTEEQERVIGAVFSVAWRILEWIEFHAGTFNFTRDFLIEFLELSLFTSEGIIDNHKVQEKMSEKSINNLQKFQLACFNCDQNIAPLFNNLSIEDKKLVYNDENPKLVKQTEIVKFWAYYAMGEIDKIREQERIDRCRTRYAILSGSQLAVDYCLSRTKAKQTYGVDIAASIFRHRMFIDITAHEYMNAAEDSVIFRQKRYNCTDEYWVPRSFFVDMFYTLFVEMDRDQRTDFWKEIFDKRFIKNNSNLGRVEYADLLEYFLCWPHQVMFSELIRTSWNHLPFQVFTTLLQKLVKRIAPKKGTMFYGEGKLYDYRKMLMEVWSKTTPVVKRYLHRYNSESMLKLFELIYNLETFNDTDRRNIKSILESAENKDKRRYLLSNSGFSLCLWLLERRRFNLFHELVTHCFNSGETVRDYKLRVIVSKAIRLNCLTSIKEERWDEAVEKFGWSGYPLTQLDIDILKVMLINHNDGKETCIEIWKIDPAKAEYFINWCVPDKEVDYKKDLIYSDVGQEECRNLCVVDPEEANRFVNWFLPPDKTLQDYRLFLVQQVNFLCACTKYVLKDDTPELADKLVNWCLPRDRVEELKKALGFRIEVYPDFVKNLVGIEHCRDEDFPDTIFDWKEWEKMFDWCFDSDPDLVKKLKVTYINKNKRRVFYECISTNNWDAADRFISWLDVGEIEARILKKEQICSDGETRQYLNLLLNKEDGNEIFAKSGGKQKTIERFIHWFLVDDGSTVPVFTRWLERFGDNMSIENIISKLKASDEVETIRELLKKF